MGLVAALGLRGRKTGGLQLGAALGAVAYSGFLFYVSKTQLGYVCAWCLRLYGTNAALLVLAPLVDKPALPGRDVLAPVLGAYAAFLVATVGGERVYRASISGGGGAAPASALAASGAHEGADPKGEAPALSFTVTTEDKNERTFSLDPDDAWTGNRNAKVAVVMFGDLECGYCKRSSAELARLEATYGDRVLFVFKHFPMDPTCNSGVKNRKHKDACEAAKASVCAQEQGRFWAFHDLAYKNQHQLGDEFLRQYAVAAGADGGKFDACIESDTPMDVVKHDADVGASLDIHGTPRIFIDGKLYRSGTSAEAMARALEMALGADAATASKAAGAMKDTKDVVAAIPADVPATRTIQGGSGAFSIDTFEAAIVDGKAVSARHQVPAFKVSWFEAKDACEAAGKRLCTEEEWTTACQGAPAKDDNQNGQYADDMIEGTAYPYGDYHDEGRCWDAKNPDSSRPVYTGEMPGCASKDGVYDLTGNVEEWVGDSPEKAVLLGGAYDTSEDHARCYRRNDTFGAGYSAGRTGFRCCTKSP
jgi:protein-disulfide isomerase